MRIGSAWQGEGEGETYLARQVQANKAVPFCIYGARVGVEEDLEFCSARASREGVQCAALTCHLPPPKRTDLVTLDFASPLLHLGAELSNGVDGEGRARTDLESKRDLRPRRVHSSLMVLLSWYSCAGGGLSASIARVRYSHDGQYC